MVFKIILLEPVTFDQIYIGKYNQLQLLKTESEQHAPHAATL